MVTYHVHVVYNTIHIYVNRSPKLTTPPDFTAVKLSFVEDIFFLDPYWADGLPRGLNNE